MSGGPEVGYPLAMTDTATGPDPADVEVLDLAPRAALAIRFETAPRELGNRLGEALPRIARYLEEKGIPMEGPPFTRYLAHDEEAGTFTVEAGLPVPEPAEGTDEILSVTLPGGPTARLVFQGHYERLGEAHSALMQWLERENRPPSGPPWEVYVSDPGEVTDPAQLRTDIYQPLAPE